MNIFLVYPTMNIWRNSLYSYGLGYIASVLKEKGHRVCYFHLTDRTDVSELYSRTEANQPEIIAFAGLSSQMDALKPIIKQIRRVSGSFLVIGGPHPTLYPESISEIEEVDAIVRAEGEYPMLELADAIANGQPNLHIKNIWFKKNDRIVENEVRPSIRNLDSLPFPAKDIVDYQNILKVDNGNNRFIFSRGCTFTCTFCSNKALSEVYRDGYYRLLSPRRAIAEIDRDACRYNFSQITLDDDTINLNPKWFYEFFDLYRKTFTYPIFCNVRADIIDYEMIRLMRAAGVVGVFIGVEHGNEEFRRKYLKRKITNRKLIETFWNFDRVGIKPIAQILVGLPYETKSYFRDTVKLCRKLPLAPSNDISIFYPYPSTELWKTCSRNGWLPDGHCQERTQAPISYPNFSKSDIQLCKKLFPVLLRFRWIPLWIPLGLLNKWVSILKRFLRSKKDRLNKGWLPALGKPNRFPVKRIKNGS